MDGNYYNDRSYNKNKIEKCRQSASMIRLDTGDNLVRKTKDHEKF